MKTDTLKKSLLDYAIKGGLSARFRRENNGLNAFDELEVYNDEIREKRKKLEKELKKCEKEFKLEKDKDKKALVKSQIQMLKKELIKCKEITPLNLSEAPFAIPNSWAWVKLGDICEFRRGSFPQPYGEAKWYGGNGSMPFVQVGDIADDDFALKNKTKEQISKLAQPKSIFVPKNTFLISIQGSIGRVAITQYDCYVDRTIAIFTDLANFLNQKFLAYILFVIFQEKGKNARGTTIKTITKEEFKNFTIPLPPLCEQQEIVGKLDLLTTLANDFAITKENLKRIEKRIEKSLLKLALEGSLSKGYRRASPTLCAFDEISTYNDKIKEKRKKLEKKLKICEKEFKLEKDKDKKALVKSQIQMLKKELTKCKEITPLNLSEAPFAIPNSWAWVKLGDICEIISGTSYGKDDLSDEGIRILRGGNINKNSHNVDLFADDVTIKQDLASKEKQILKNDILMIASTGSKEIIGKSAFSDVALKNTQIGAFLRIIRIAKEQNAKYIFHNLISQIFATHIKSCAGGTNILNIKNEYIENFLIPLPPLQEQKEITQTLDTLFTLKKGLRRE